MIKTLEEEEIKKKAGGEKQSEHRKSVINGAFGIRENTGHIFMQVKVMGCWISSCYKGIKLIENTLIKHVDFALHDRKALLKRDMEYEIVLIDATETPIEYPKKGREQEPQLWITFH